MEALLPKLSLTHSRTLDKARQKDFNASALNGTKNNSRYFSLFLSLSLSRVSLSQMSGVPNGTLNHSPTRGEQGTTESHEHGGFSARKQLSSLGASCLENGQRGAPTG